MPTQRDGEGFRFFPKVRPLAEYAQGASQEAFARARSRAARRRCRRCDRRDHAEAGSRGTGVAGNRSATGGSFACSGSLGRASMNANTPRPFSVMRQPPFRRSTSPCEKMSRSGTRPAMCRRSWPPPESSRPRGCVRRFHSAKCLGRSRPGRRARARSLPDRTWESPQKENIS